MEDEQQNKGLRKSRVRLTTMGVWLATLVALGGCAQPPASELKLVDAAMKAATTEGAQQYAPNQFRKAQEAQAALQAELAVQDGRLRMLRSFGKTSQLAAAAKIAADDAESAALVERNRLEHEVLQLVQDATTIMDDAITAVNGEGLRRSAKELANLRAELERGITSLRQADTAIANKDLNHAQLLAQAAVDSATKVRLQLRRPRAGVNRS